MVRNSNVDNEDKLKVLVGFKKCLVDQFKTCEEHRRNMKYSLRDKLLSELIIRYVDSVNDCHTDYLRRTHLRPAKNKDRKMIGNRKGIDHKI